MTRFTKTKKALCALTDTILGGSSNVVRTLKVAGHMNENSVKHVSDVYKRQRSLTKSVGEHLAMKSVKGESRCQPLALITVSYTHLGAELTGATSTETETFDVLGDGELLL